MQKALEILGLESNFSLLNIFDNSVQSEYER